MVPRGLAVAVCVGMAAGAVAAAALHGKGDAWTAGMPVSYVEGASVSVAVERADYRPGEYVRIRVVNTGTVPLEFADGSYGVRVTQLDGIEVYSPRPESASAASGDAAPGAAATLGPREEATVVWNQTKNDGGAALHGTYKISSSAAPAAGAAAGAEGLDASVTINILR